MVYIIGLCVVSNTWAAVYVYMIVYICMVMVTMLYV